MGKTGNGTCSMKGAPQAHSQQRCLQGKQLIRVVCATVVCAGTELHPRIAAIVAAAAAAAAGRALQRERKGGGGGGRQLQGALHQRGGGRRGARGLARARGAAVPGRQLGDRGLQGGTNGLQGQDGERLLCRGMEHTVREERESASRLASGVGVARWGRRARRRGGTRAAPRPRSPAPIDTPISSMPAQEGGWGQGEGARACEWPAWVLALTGPPARPPARPTALRPTHPAAGRR